MKVPLKGGGEAIVSRQDVARVAGIRWRIRRVSKTLAYAICSGKPSRMHHYILPPIPGFVVDHINGNGLDNRRNNLRYATIHENVWNSRVSVRRKIPFKGIYPAARNRWRVRLQCKGVMHTVGVYNSLDSAIEAYDKAAAEHYGKFARLNGRRSQGVTNVQRKKVVRVLFREESGGSVREEDRAKYPFSPRNIIKLGDQS